MLMQNNKKSCGTHQHVKKKERLCDCTHPPASLAMEELREWQAEDRSTSASYLNDTDSRENTGISQLWRAIV